VACQLLGVRAFADEANLLKTPLYDFHVEHGGAPRCRPGLRCGALAPY